MDERERHQAILAVNRAIASAEDQAEILRLVVERAGDITGATACVLLLAGDDGLARVVRSTGIYPDSAVDWRRTWWFRFPSTSTPTSAPGSA